MPKWLKISLKVLGSIVLLVLILFIAAGIYVAYNKKKVLTLISNNINKSIDGHLSIGDIDPTFFSGFPDVSVSLKNVSLQDRQWEKHKHTLLNAKDVEVAINPFMLIGGSIDIKKISINNAGIDLFTDSTGYSNLSVFKKKKPKPKPAPEDGDGSDAMIKRIDLNNVTFRMDNQKNNKLFTFHINKIKGNVDYPTSGWNARADVDILVKSMAFNTDRGSFLKDKTLRGPFSIQYTEDTGIIDLAPANVKIGDDDFTLSANFKTGAGPDGFAIHVKADNLLWKHASALLADNIQKKLNMFALQKPVAVNALIQGQFKGGGGPLIQVECRAKDNVLIGNVGRIDNCNFTGKFTNNYVNGKGTTDENSAIMLYNLTGTYKEMPFKTDTLVILNFKQPIAQGSFKSTFPLAKLNNTMEDGTLKFGGGTADLDLHYKAPVDDYKLIKPLFKGSIKIKGANITYVPRGLKLQNTSLSMFFTGDDLLFKNIRLQSGHSVVLMDGKIKNFLNFYYDAPEKLLLTWYIRSPQMYLNEFLGFLNHSQYTPKRRTGNSTNFTEQMGVVFEKGNAELHMLVEKVYYKKFVATDAIASVLLADNKVNIKSISVKHAGGSLNITGNVLQNGNNNSFDIHSKINKVNISKFFYSFDNFGMKSLTSENLHGFLSANANIKGRISNEGTLVSRSIFGDLSFTLNNGVLKSFEPIKKVGKFVFPFRDLDNITFSELNGKFDLRGEKINIQPLMISSSVLNIDVAGIYSLGSGTHITMEVPLRNPKDDYKIADKEERMKKRMKGIVVHLMAVDGDDGGIKIKLNRDYKKKKDKDDDDDDKADEKQSR